MQNHATIKLSKPTLSLLVPSPDLISLLDREPPARSVAGIDKYHFIWQDFLFDE